jgi:hypothetical protein
VERAQAARLCARALNEREDKQRREEVEATELALRLLSNPSGTQSGADQVVTDRPDDGGTAGGAEQTAFDAENHPALVVGRLESSKTGCMWLVEQWTALRTMLENGGAWPAPARLKAMRLLGTYPGDPLAPPALDGLLRACGVLDSNTAFVAGVNSPVDGQNVAEQSGEAPLADEARARQELLDLVTNEMERIEVRLVEHDERGELEGLLANHFSAWDESPQGERLRRYELTFHRCVFQTIDQFNKRKRNQNPDDRYAAAPAYGRMDRSQLEQYLPRIADISASVERENAAAIERNRVASQKIGTSEVPSSKR